jgi:hypothetical protein
MGVNVDALIHHSRLHFSGAQKFLYHNTSGVWMGKDIYSLVIL